MYAMLREEGTVALGIPESLPSQGLKLRRGRSDEEAKPKGIVLCLRRLQDLGEADSNRLVAEEALGELAPVGNVVEPHAPQSVEVEPRLAGHPLVGSRGGRHVPQIDGIHEGIPAMESNFELWLRHPRLPTLPVRGITPSGYS